MNLVTHVWGSTVGLRSHTNGDGVLVSKENNWQTNLFDSYIETQQILQFRVRVDMGEIEVNEYSPHPIALV